MVEIPAAPRRHFLGWDDPLPGSAAAWLAREWARRGPLDLSAQAVLVPTRQAGRRLRAALAALAAEHDQAVLAPRILTPEALVPTPPVAAGALAARLAWVDVLRQVDLADFREVFPADPPRRDASWSLRLARQLVAIQRMLGEAGLTLDAVAPRLASDFPERLRWTQLGALGRLQAERLRRAGWLEPEGARIASADAPPPLPGIQRLVVLAVPDPLPLAVVALERHAMRIQVDVVVAAPAEEQDSFDAWGRPVPEAWARRALPWPDFARQVHVCADPSDQGEWIARLAASYRETEGRLACGIADPEVTPRALESLVALGLPAFDPAGRSHRDSALHELLSALAAFARDPSFEATARLGRQAMVLRAWATPEAGGPGAAAWLAALDQLRGVHLPEDLAQARAVASGPAAVVLARLADLHEQLRRGSVVEILARVVPALWRNGSGGAPAQPDLVEVWGDVMAEAEAASGAFRSLGDDFWWEALVQRLAEGRADEEKAPGALELGGWLELPWEDAPHVLVAGANEGVLPETVAGDAFLPESLRCRLGLRTNEQRFARDCYLLCALLASRRRGGRVDVLVGRCSAGGDPLKPSRLLFAGSDDDLPERVRLLFREARPAAALPAWRRPWRLQPRRTPPPTSLRVTGFRRYLECPFRFYLADVLRLESVDSAKSELDALDFGSLCHRPLERLVEPRWRDCVDEAALAGEFVSVLERDVARRYGASLALPLELQVESARQRLRRAAAVQAAERAAGWVVVAVEHPFKLTIAGLEVAGRFDRLDRHERTGAWRVVDYKTTDAGPDAAEAHLARRPPNPTPSAWARAPSAEGRDRFWIDLQLPLYLEALPTLGFGGPAVGAYFLLPKAVGDTRLSVWEDYSSELHRSALTCAEGVAAAVGSGVFWPPNEEFPLERDPFASCFHRGVAASVAWEGADS